MRKRYLAELDEITKMLNPATAPSGVSPEFVRESVRRSHQLRSQAFCLIVKRFSRK